MTEGSAAQSHAVDVAIAGGGIAGIAAAVELASRGFKVALVESRSILGGRARSWVDGTTKDPVHIGPHVVVTDYPNFFKLLETLGTRDRIVWQPSRHFITMVQGREENHFRTQPLPAPLSWGPASTFDPFVSYADKHTTVPAAIHCLSLSEEQVDALDSQSGADFLRGLGVSDAYIEHFWGFLSHAILNVPVEEASAAALVRFFRALVGQSSMEMGFSDGGLGDLFKPAKARLEALGGMVKISTEVTKFLQDSDGACKGFVLDDGSVIEARVGVISTLPPHTVLPLLPVDWVQQHREISSLEALKPCKYISVYLWFDRQVTGGRQMWARRYKPGDLNCEFYDFSHIYTGADSKGTAWSDRASFIGSNIIDSGRLSEMSDEAVVAGTLRELSEFFPEVDKAQLKHSVVNRVPMAIHRPVVGTEMLRPDQATPVKRLFFAGCWTQTRFPSSMESAAMSAYLAVERLLAAHMEKPQIAVPHRTMSLTARMVGSLDFLRPWLLSPLFRTLCRVSGGVPPSRL